MHEVEVDALPKEKVIDTNGAGDTFLSGLFAHMLKFDGIQKTFINKDID